MKRNFTQVFMGMALLVGFTTSSYAQCDEPIPAPEGALYSWQFDGGLDGWRATNLADEDVDQTATLPTADQGTVFGWVWDAEGRVSGGAFNTDNGTDFIVSPSVCNGAVVFNADFYDNQGPADPVAFGQGVCPNGDVGFCEGFLKSPPIDLSGFEGEVALQFNQALRQFTSEFFIYLSNDGGVSYFDTIQINDLIEVNSNHLLTEQLTIPLCGLAGAADARVDFLYRGSYYYWAIDDVAIVPSINPDVRVNSNFTAITTNFGTPGQMAFELPFIADIENLAAVQANTPELTVTVRNEAGDIVHTQTRLYDDVPGCMTDENKVFPETFTPPAAVGFYTVDYEINTLNDSNNTNDIVGGQFEITNNEFKKVISEEEAGAEYLDIIRYSAGPFQSWGSYFYFPNNDDSRPITSVRAGIATTGGAMLEVGEIVCAVYQWVDVNEDGMVNSGAAEEKIKLGEATYLITPENTDSRDFELIPLDEDGELIVPEPGSEILIMLHTNPFGSDINYFGLNVPTESSVSFSTGASTLGYGELGLTPRYGSFGGVGTAHDDRDEERDYFSESRWTWYINANITPLVTGTEDINENLGIEVFPSPASNLVNVSLDLEELSPIVNIEMINMAGVRAGSYDYSNIKNDKVSIDVSNYTGGMYLMIIRTEAGMITKKISVVH